jgi:hypothetical protein
MVVKAKFQVRPARCGWLPYYAKTLFLRQSLYLRCGMLRILSHAYPKFIIGWRLRARKGKTRRP